MRLHVKRAAEHHLVMAEIEKEKNMSLWYNVKDKEDIDLSDDGEFVHILYNTDRNGNNYVEIPLEILLERLKELQLEDK